MLPELPEREGERYSVLPYKDDWPFAVDRDHSGFPPLPIGQFRGITACCTATSPPWSTTRSPSTSLAPLYPEETRRGDDRRIRQMFDREGVSREGPVSGRSSHLLKLRQDKDLQNLRFELKPRP